MNMFLVGIHKNFGLPIQPMLPFTCCIPLHHTRLLQSCCQNSAAGRRAGRNSPIVSLLFKCLSVSLLFKCLRRHRTTILTLWRLCESKVAATATDYLTRWYSNVKSPLFKCWYSVVGTEQCFAVAQLKTK